MKLWISNLFCCWFCCSYWSFLLFVLELSLYTLNVIVMHSTLINENQYEKFFGISVIRYNYFLRKKNWLSILALFWSDFLFKNNHTDCLQVNKQENNELNFTMSETPSFVAMPIFRVTLFSVFSSILSCSFAFPSRVCFFLF